MSIALSVLHWFTPSYYPLVSFVHCFVRLSLTYIFLLPLGIFCPLLCLSVIDLRLLITTWYLVSIVLSVCHWFTSSYDPLVSFVHCFVCPSLIYAFLLPLGILCPLFCPSVIDLHLLMTPWYLLFIALSVRHWFTPSYYPLVSFVHCFVRLSLTYIFLLPLGIFCPLLCLSVIDLRLLITTWYLVSIVLSVCHWFTSSYDPLVSFVHCFVCPWLIYAFLLPLGILCPLFCPSVIDLHLLMTPWYLLFIALSVLQWFTPSYYPLVSFVHCFFRLSLTYIFLLPLGIFCPLFFLSFIDLSLLITAWYLLSIALSVRQWFTPSYYPLVSFVHCFVRLSLIYIFLLPLGIFCSLLCLSFNDLRLLITPWYLLSIVFSVLHWFTPSYYPLVSFVHCIVCLSLNYVFLLPLGIFYPLFCRSFIDLHLLITPWYLLSIALSVFLWIMSSYYPLVSFVHCSIRLSLIYAFLLPLGIFCPLFFLSFINLRLLITPWYLLSIALSVLHWFTPSYYPLVSFVHCFVRLSLTYIFLLPLGIFCPLLCLSVIDLRLLITTWYLVSIVLSVCHWFTSSYDPLVSFVHCFVCPSLIYAFLLPLGILCPLFCPSVIDLHLLMTPWYLLFIALSVRHWFTPSYYPLVSFVHCFVRLSLTYIFLLPLGIFCPLLCLSVIDLRLLITTWYLVSIVLSVCHWFTSSYDPLVSFVHCFVCPWLIYAFLLPLGILCPLFCPSVIDLHLLMTPWYLLFIALSVLQWFTPSYYPLVSFVHCFFRLSLTYIFLLPLGIFCPLFFLSFIDLSLLITAWYLLSIALSVRQWFTPSYYPLVSFVHCFVRLSLIYIFLLPLGIFCSLLCLSFNDLRLLITPWYLLSIVFSVLHWFTPSYYPLVSFVHCIVCLSLNYVFLLPLGIFYPLFCPSVIDLHLLITAWYLLSIVFSVFHWLTSSYYPLVSFVHCFFRLSLTYIFLLPLGIFCPLFFPSFIDLHLLITPWYLLSIVFSVLHWFITSHYRLVSFVHCFVCPSVIYAFLLPLGIFCPLFCPSVIDLHLLITPWYLLFIALSVLQWFTPSYYPLVSFVHCFFCPSLIYAFLLPLGIFCPFYCLSFIELCLLITPWYLLSIVLSVCHWFTSSYYRLVSFVNCFFCPSLIYAFLLPLGIFCPLLCLSFIDLRLLITPWYLLSIVLSVFHWLTSSYYPLVSFVHCFVCPSLIYAFLLSIGIFCPLFCLSFIDLRLLITPWYLLSIVLSVHHWFTPSYYPLVSFVHLFICPSLMYAFLLPLGILCPLFFCPSLIYAFLLPLVFLIHCFVCPSLIYAFLLPLGIFCPLFCLFFCDLRLLITPWYLLSIVFSVLNWYMPSYYPLVSFVLCFVCASWNYVFLLPLGIFCPLFCLSFIDLRPLITPWYLLSIILFVLHWFTPSYYPLVSFVHYFVCPSLIYAFLLPLGIFCPLFCLSFIDWRLLITPWYLLSIILSVLHWFTPSYYPLVSFVHYCVCPSLIYVFLLPLGIFCPLLCLSFIDLRLLITPWYFLSIILSVLHCFTCSYYPLVSFVHYFVCPLLIYAFLLPLGIFCPLFCLSFHWFTSSYYPLVSFVYYFVCPSLVYAFLLPLGIFCPLFCLFFIELRLLITPWYLLSIIVSVLHWFTSSYYPLVSFVHYCVCPSLIYAFLLPLGIFCPLFCLSFIDLRPLITPWYLLSIILFVLHWFTPSYYPLVSFVHYFVCPSLIYVFLLPLGIFCPLFCLSFIGLRLLITPWYLLSIIVSVLHWLTPSYYPLVSFVQYFVCPSLIYVFLLPLGIFCPLFCLSFIDLRLLITPWYLLSIILFVLHWFTPSYYPSVSFVRYFVCPSLIYAFLLPLGIFCPLFFLSFIDSRLLIIHWYLLSIALSVLHWFTPSYYPLVSFVHCFVCPSLIYAFLLPLGIFCPLFCLSFIDLRLLIIHWYLLSIILFVLHWFTPSYYPSVSFVHYFVCPSLIYAFLLSLGIFCPLFFLSFIDSRLLITAWYLLSIALSVLHWFTPSYYRLVSFVHYFVCPSLIYAFLLPLGIFCPLFCLSFIDLRLFITPWYLLSIVLSVLHWFTPSYYPLVSFVHLFICPSLMYAFLLPLGILCPLFFCPSLIYAFLLPLGIFNPLFCLSFIDLRLLITPWYLLSIVLSVLLWFTSSYYPLVSFVHCFFCP